VVRTFPIDHSSRVAEVRRAAAALCHEEGMDETLSSNAALVATELCTNLLKHAQNGEIFLSTLSDRGGPGVEILAVDRGPGMTDIAKCLADGYSSANTAGTGLGAIARVSQEFDIYSERNRGTVAVAQVRRDKFVTAEVGAVLKPISGEEVAGDAWAVYERDSHSAMIVADGLGHGLMATRAAAEAISAFRRNSEAPPLAILNRVHTALRGTRGAAVAVACIDRGEFTVKYAGIGNITGAIVQSGKPQIMVSHNGTAGFHAQRLQEFSYSLPEQGLIVMHSDGLTSNWNLDNHPGLRRRHPSIIAAVLYRDASRNRDDVCVVAAKFGRTS
jgi:anti-sigma regulatory factor (Ser/Thr protein kinase)